MSFTLVLIAPPEPFDLAVLARTLYAALGVEAEWRILYTGLRGSARRAWEESRVPLRVWRERVAPLKQPLSGVAAKLEAGGEPAWSSTRSDVLYVCYSGSCDWLAGYSEAKPVEPPFPSSPTYSAVAVIYEWLVRGCEPRLVKPVPPRGREAARATVYLARKALEACTVYDNHPLLQPSTLAYVARKAGRWLGIHLEPTGWRVESDFVTGSTVEVVEFEVYDSRLRRIGEARITYKPGTGELRVEAPRWEAVVLVDCWARRACVEESTCFTIRGESDAAIPPLTSSVDV